MPSQIDPDFAEYFQHDLVPMVHYVPASLENVTEVVAYVLDPAHGEEMQGLVTSANAWCKRSMSKEALSKDVMVQLKEYEYALDQYMLENKFNETLVSDDILNELVECV